MKLETFFDKFDLFADAPDAVEKMRELVLDLAVQGKVADQDPNDQPAAELLNRLIQFKLDNPLTGRSGRSKEGPVEVEASRDGLPQNWVNTTIGEVLYVIRGASPRPKGDPQYFSEARTPYHWVKISDIRKHGQNGLLMDTDEFLTEAGMRKSVLLPKGTLVLTNSATIGVPIVLGIEGCCIHDGYLAFPNFPHDLLSQKFLLYLFHTLKKHAERNARGLAQLNLNTDLVRSFPFGLPPLAEQKRIVAKVDELMALCDRLEAQQQEREAQASKLVRASLARFADAPNPANLQFLFHPSYAIPPTDLRKSILTLAVQGKLVPQDPNDEPADDTLAKVLRARERQEKSLRIKEPTPVEADAEHTPDLPSGWCYASPDQLTAFHKNALTIGPFGSSLLKSDYTDEGVPLVFVRDIRSEAFGGPETRFVTADKADELASHTVRPGDLLITKMGDPPGDTAIYPDGRPPAIITADCIKLTPHSDVVRAEYLRFTIRAAQIAEQFAGITLGVAQQKVSLGRFRCIAIPLPPLAEQRRIVAKVEQLMALVDALETQLAASRATAANLLSALVAELTGTSSTGKVSVPSASSTGRPGRPPKSR